MGFNISQIANSKEQAVPVKGLGLKQRVNTRTVVVPTSGEEIILTTTKAFVLDELIFSTNRSTGLQVRVFAIVNGTETPVSDVSYDGTGGQGFFAEQMVTHGSAFFDVIQYDSMNNRYKFALKKSLTFAEGAKITVRNTSPTEDARASVSVMGREYE